MSPKVKAAGAIIFTIVALVIVFFVITDLGHKYSADDKKAAWGALTFIGGFWLGSVAT